MMAINFRLHAFFKRYDYSLFLEANQLSFLIGMKLDSAKHLYCSIPVVTAVVYLNFFIIVPLLLFQALSVSYDSNLEVVEPRVNIDQKAAPNQQLFTEFISCFEFVPHRAVALEITEFVSVKVHVH